MNAFDANLNKDIHDGVHHHVSKTHTISDDDTQKFIIDMERIRTQTYWRIFNARSVALEGRIGRQKKKGVGPGRSGKCMKGSG
eukprot:6036703-Ditylum_brightwellii.AAC.1